MISFYSFWVLYIYIYIYIYIYRERERERERKCERNWFRYKNNWNHTIVYTLFALERKTWYHITVQEFLRNNHTKNVNIIVQWTWFLNLKRIRMFMPFPRYEPPYSSMTASETYSQSFLHLTFEQEKHISSPAIGCHLIVKIESSFFLNVWITNTQQQQLKWNGCCWRMYFLSDHNY